MQIVCNELSFSPFTEDSNILELRVRDFFKVFDGLLEKYGFNQILVPKNFFNQKITSTQTILMWASSISSHSLKNLVLNLFRPPYLGDDLDENELNEYCSCTYNIRTSGKVVAPFGLAVAYIKSLPTLSLHSLEDWKTRNIELNLIPSESEHINVIVYNLCLVTDIESSEFNYWLNNYFTDKIDSLEGIKKYLNFSKYSIKITDNFMAQLFEWKNANNQIFKKILSLMKDVEMFPFTGGIGQTEVLKHGSGQSSKRITNKYPDGDRLSYKIEDNCVTYISCKGHYEHLS